jgi:DNA-directed RNA polymerase specialized sigma24 family protein
MGDDAPRAKARLDESAGKDPAVERQTAAEEPTAPMNDSTNAAAPAAPAAPVVPAVAPRPAPPPEHVARVLSAVVQKLIERRIARAGIPEQDRGDYQQVVTAALLYMADPPEDDEGCAKAAHAITARKIAGERRQAFRRGEVNVGPTDQEDSHPSEDGRDLANGQHAQRVATLREAMNDGTLTERDQQILAMKREGLKDAEIAAKVGLKTQTVSNRIATLRKEMRQKWQTRVTKIASLAFVVLVVVLTWGKREEIAHFLRLVPAPTPAPAPTRPGPEPSIPVALQAAKLRREAAEACGLKEWEACSDDLEAAAKLDPAGETQPQVRDLRHAVEDNIRFERPASAKPGYPR